MNDKFSQLSITERQIGQILISAAQPKHTAIWPHSSYTQSIFVSQHILQRSSSCVRPENNNDP